MKTKITESPTIAARFIMHGEIVAFPTETVYGLGAHIFNVDAIRKIFAAKGRPADNPLIAHIYDLAQLESITSASPAIARKLIKQFFPGPLTLVLPKSGSVPSIATASLKTIAVRMPKHAIAQQFLRACKVPVVAPSANLSGRTSPTTWRAVRDDLDGRIGCLLKGDQSEIGLESTVIDCTSKTPVVLRAGAVTLEDLQSVVPEITVADPKTLTVIKSPGLSHRHYSPKAKVIICSYPQFTIASNDAAYIGLAPPPHADSFNRVLICRNIQDYAHSLYRFFHECDEASLKTIFCQSVKEEGLGLALMDRIERASQD